jgi:CheY-like chemotaxis protein
LQMPVMDGLEAAKRLREMEENSHFSRYVVASETNVGTGSGSGAGTPTSRSAQNANNNSVTSQPINPPPMSPKARSFSNGRQIVIGVSANSDNDTVEEAFRAGFDAFLAKPFTIDSFYDTFGKVKRTLQCDGTGKSTNKIIKLFS